MDIHDERVSPYYIYICFLSIKGDFLVKLRIRCSTLIVLVLQKHNHVYIWSYYGLNYTWQLRGVLQLHHDFFSEIKETEIPSMLSWQCPRNMSVFQTCLTFTMQFYNGLHSIVRQMSDVSLPHFAYTVMIINWVVCSSSLNNSLKHCIQTHLCVS